MDFSTFEEVDIPFTIIPFEDVDIPFADLQEQQPDIKAFSASTMIFHWNPLLSKRYILLCQRAYWDYSLEKPNSYGGSWEGPGGSHDPGEDIPDTAIRETREEVKLRVSHFSPYGYRDSWVHKGIPMARYTFCVDVHEQLQPQRKWCDKQQGPVGTEEGCIELEPNEHSDFCWATEEQVRDSRPFDEENPQQEGLVMLESKKKIILDAFKRWENSRLDMILAEKPRVTITTPTNMV